MAKITHHVYRTAFHGGGLVSRHSSQEAAGRAVVKFRKGTSCRCGCAVAVSAERVKDLPESHNAKSPYEASK